MTLADVNVLVNAFRTDVPHHMQCRAWLDRTIRGETRFGVSRLVLNATVRITTDRRIYVTPSTTVEAFAFCNDILRQPHCQIVVPGERHWSIFERLCIDTGTRGSRVTDAWYAALAIESGCEWITLDRDYARFPGLKWYAPD